MRNLRAILASLFVGVLTMLVIACGAETNPPADPTSPRDAEPTSIVSQPAAASAPSPIPTDTPAPTAAPTAAPTPPHRAPTPTPPLHLLRRPPPHRNPPLHLLRRPPPPEPTAAPTAAPTGTHRCTYCGAHPHAGTHRCTYCGTHPHPHCRSDTYAGSDSHSGVQSGQLLLLYRGDQHQPGGHHRGALRRRSPPDRE